jgi:branched-chain amino acid transport system ATP-binding protein
MLRLDRVSAGYGDTVVLRDVDLVVPSGSVAALLGPNGAGKTTLLRVASGLLRPTAGRVLIDGDDVTGSGAYAMSQHGICHVPEGRGIFRSLTVRENLALFGPAGDENEAVELAVEAFPRLGERLGQQAGTMSGGEQQMLALARTYVGKPALVLLDEVSLGLAPIVVDAIFEFLARLAASGTALLLVEQYLSHALELAEYVYVLDRGRISYRGEPSEVDEERVFLEYVGGAV